MATSSTITDMYSFLRDNKVLGTSIASNNLGSFKEHLIKLEPYKSLNPRGLTQDMQTVFGLALHIMEKEHIKKNREHIRRIVDEVFYDDGKTLYPPGTVYSAIVGCSRSKESIDGSIMNDPICAASFLQADYGNMKHEDTTVLVTEDDKLKVMGKGTSDRANIMKLYRDQKITEHSRHELYKRFGVRHVTEYIYDNKDRVKVQSYTLTKSGETEGTYIFTIVIGILIVLFVVIALVLIYRYMQDGKEDSASSQSKVEM